MLYCRCGAQGEILAANDEFSSNMKRAPGSLDQESIFTLLNNCCSQNVRQAVSELDLQNPSVQLRLKFNHNATDSTECTMTGIFVEDELHGFILTSHDQTLQIGPRAKAVAHHEVFADVASNVLFEVDYEGRLLYIGSAWEKITGQSVAKALGHGWMKLFEEQAMRDLQKVMFALKTGDPMRHVRVRATRKNGEHRWLDLSAQAHWGQDNDIMSWSGNVYDVTAEVESQIRSSQLLKILDATSDFFVLEESENRLVRYSNDPSRFQLGILPGEEGGDATFETRLSNSSQRIWKDEVLPAIAGTRIWSGELHLEPCHGLNIDVTATCVGHLDDQTGIELISILAKDITAQKNAESDLAHAASHDSLTGLANRSNFFRAMETALSSAHRTGQKIAVMYCDLDDFKDVNDTLGHDAGDSVLSTVGDRLKACVRDNDVVARFGGDEFVVLCTALPSSANLNQLADRLLKAIAKPIEVGKVAVSVGISIGLAYSDMGDSLDSLVIRADEALYVSKERGKNQAYIASSNRAVK